ncbi:diacylglycerol kinase [Noviherbaspirillum sp. CPCC 100848]|uniref:Diacylglycerol kinase n=1 Tax=Noviherbaspirillum album TaxID=3080276 RepID=A0ABU6JIE7_9BURK|nr:diacylglycerol kinase [Noviherbaspirillum sp. CPCC 100848]MEC4723055.1 diacylglycerol kinase [Noviherbaspirillum sp. CPCC 100848]
MTENKTSFSEFKSKSGLKRIMSAASYSMQGFKAAWRNEHAFRQELAVVVPAMLLALFLPLPAVHRLALVAVLINLLIVELLNSAIETVVDRISLERHPLSKVAKDVGSAAVFLALLLAAATWIVILLPLARAFFTA